jgi:hypothetical protein
MGKVIYPSVLFGVDISQKPNPMMAFRTPSSLHISYVREMPSSDSAFERVSYLAVI